MTFYTLIFNIPKHNFINHSAQTIPFFTYKGIENPVRNIKNLKKGVNDVQKNNYTKGRTAIPSRRIR